MTAADCSTLPRKGEAVVPGFAIMALCCLLAETLQSFRCKQDVVHTPEERCSYPEGPCIIVPQTTTVDAFKAFLKRPAFNGAFTDEQVASSFVNGVRNGILPIAGAVYDRWSRGRVHSVYWWGLALLVLGVAARVALLGSPTWAHAMQSLFG